jgi:hypothetical protein
MTVGVRGFNPIWLLDDLTGHLFDDSFWFYVLENTIPYIPETVYHDPDLSIPWTNPIQFLANGTLPVDIFFDPTKVYRLEFRKNLGLAPPSQDDPLIYEVNDYSPGTGSITPADNSTFVTGNQITNPQFAIINFSSPLTITTAGTYEISPGWFLDLAGAGSAVITQVPLTSANPNPSNAPYALHFVLSGWDADSVVLRQRFQQNGLLWANKTVSAAVTARTGVGNQSLTANLVDSASTMVVNVLTIPTITGAFVEYTGHGLMPASTDTDIPPAAYIELQVHIASNNDIYLTSFQLIVQAALNIAEPPFEQDSINRQIDHTFNYYQPGLIFKQTPNLLTGWDFALNPRQFGAVTPVVTAANYYLDQTIMGTAVGNVALTFNAVTDGIQLTNASAAEAIYLLQYLSQAQAKKILGTSLAVNVQSFCDKTNVISRVYLYRAKAASSIPTLTTTIGTIAASGVFTLTGAAIADNWTLISQGTSSPAIGKVANVAANADINKSNVDLGFKGWEVTDNTEIGDTDKFAIVVTYQIPTVTTVLTVQSISCVPGDIPTRPSPQTPDEVLRECQYYFETTFQSGSSLSATTNGQLTAPMVATLTAGTSVSTFVNTFGYNFASLKRTNPNLTLYSGVTVTPGHVQVFLDTIGGGVTTADAPVATFWSTVNAFNKSFSAIPSVSGGSMLTNNTPGNTNNSTAWIQYHYIADARLGVV